MTTPPGWEPRPGPTQGETARRPPRAAAGDWPDDPAGRRVGGRGRDDYDPRGRAPRNGPRWNGRPPADQGKRQGEAGPSRPPAPDGLRSSPALRWVGALSTRNAMLAMAAGTLLGIALTLAAGSEPGFLLGLFITLGAVVGVIGIRRSAVYLFFPLPPFAFFIGAVITGKVHDSSLTSSTAGLVVSGLLPWIADIFFPMCVATVLVLLIGGARWLLGRQLVGGYFPMSDNRPGSPRSPRPRSAPGPRPDVDPWATPNTRVRREPPDDPWAADPRSADPRSADPRSADPRSGRDRPGQRPGGSARLGPDGARPTRPARDQRDDRDPWGDPRSAADRRQPTRNVPPPNRNVPPANRDVPPPAAQQPAFRPRPAKPGQSGQSGQSGDRAPRPPAPPRPVRPPGDSRDQRY